MILSRFYEEDRQYIEAQEVSKSNDGDQRCLLKTDQWLYGYGSRLVRRVCRRTDRIRSSNGIIRIVGKQRNNRLSQRKDYRKYLMNVRTIPFKVSVRYHSP